MIASKKAAAVFSQKVPNCFNRSAASVRMASYIFKFEKTGDATITSQPNHLCAFEEAGLLLLPMPVPGSTEIVNQTLLQSL